MEANRLRVGPPPRFWRRFAILELQSGKICDLHRIFHTGENLVLVRQSVKASIQREEQVTRLRPVRPISSAKLVHFVLVTYDGVLRQVHWAISLLPT